MVGVTPLDRATLSLVVFRPRPRHVRSIVFTKLIVIVRFFWFVVWMRFTALQVGNIKQGRKNPDHSLSSITFLIQLSIKLGTFHLMIGQCHAIIKCKGIHKSQLQSWRRNTFLCHRLERAFFDDRPLCLLQHLLHGIPTQCQAQSRQLLQRRNVKCVWQLWQLLHSSQSYGDTGGGWRGPD